MENKEVLTITFLFAVIAKNINPSVIKEHKANEENGPGYLLVSETSSFTLSTSQYDSVSDSL